MNNLTKSLLAVGVAVLVIFVYAFYWFQWRPLQIRKSCWKRAEVETQFVPRFAVVLDIKPLDTNTVYEHCLKENGL